MQSGKTTPVGLEPTLGDPIGAAGPDNPLHNALHAAILQRCTNSKACVMHLQSISGLVVEYIIAIDVTRVRFPDDASYLEAVSARRDAFHQQAKLRSSGCS